MYTGHIAVALGARGVRHDVPLWLLVLAAQGCDWVELFTHRSTSPATPDLYSHAFPFVIVAALVFTALVWIWKRSTGIALTVLALYLSHPVLDYVTGFKPFWLGGPKVGLRLVDWPLMDLVVQGTLCVLGVLLYQRSFPPTRRGRLFIALPLAALLIFQLGGDLRIGYIKKRRGGVDMQAS
jgi:hypothetical protein